MILVTGGSGLVGSHLINTLLAKGKKVCALYHKNAPKTSIHPENLKLVQGDILDVISLNEAMKDVEEVYHCAAIVSFNPAKKYSLFKTNVEGTANVVNAALQNQVKKLLYVSSVAALGRIRDNETIDEEAQWTEETSNSNYGKSKFLAEMEVWRGIAEGLNAVIVNPSIILGAGDWNNGSTAIFKNVYDEFAWFTNGATGFVGVKDLVNAMILLMENPVSAERFIINSENWTYKEMFTQIALAFNKKPPHKRATNFITELIWRFEKIKSIITGGEPLITKETARTAQTKVYYKNDKLKKYFPEFKFTALQEVVEDICNTLTLQLKER